MLSLSMASLAASAEDWVAELQPPASADFFAGNERIAIALPDAAVAAGIDRLAVEIDAFDVTALLQTDGTLLAFDPPQALSPGEHRLRLLEVAADRSLIERGAWTLEVRSNAALRELTASSDNSVDLLYRFAGNDLVDPPGHFTAQGAGEAQARVADTNWSADGNINYFLNSQQDQTVDGHRLDIGEYSFGGDYADGPTGLALRLGHQDLGAGNLIMTDFYRRGLSVTLSQPEEDLAVTAFALHSEPNLGVGNFTGVADDENRIRGVIVAARPIESLSDNIQVLGTFYEGETAAAGSGTGQIAEDRSGAGGSVTLDTLWLQERLRLRGEVALSHFDFDDSGGLPADNDLAYSFRSSYTLIPDGETDGSHLRWDLGVEYKRVGTFFASIANPALVTDRQTTAVFSDVVVGNVSMQAQAGYETSNVNRLGNLPTDRLMFATFDGTYTMTPDPDGAYGWLGQPALSLSFTFDDGRQIDRPAGSLFAGGDYQTRSATATVSSAYEAWSWTLSQTVNSFEDRSDATGDTMNYLTDLGLQFQPDASILIAPRAQLSVFRDNASVADEDVLSLGLDVTAELIPEVLSSTVNGSIDLTDSVGHTPDAYFVGGELLWTAIAADTNRPGIAVGVTGSYQHIDDADDLLPDDVVQVFGKLKLTLPVAY